MTAQVPVQASDRYREGANAPDTQAVRTALYMILALADAGIVAMAFALSDLLRHQQITDLLTLSYWLIVPVFIAASFYVRAYSYTTLIARHLSIWKAITAMLGATAATIMLLFAAKNTTDISRVAFFTGTLFSLSGLILIRLPLPLLVKGLGSHFFRRVLIVDGVFDHDVPPGIERIDVAELGIRPEITDPLMLHRFSQIVGGADRVTVSCGVEDRERWSLYLKSVDCDGELLIPELHNVEPLSDSSGLGLAGVRVSLGRMNMRNRLVKRAFDIMIAAGALIALAPAMLIVAVAIKLDSPGPILFRQQRMGRTNRLFNVLKFRSMYVDLADGSGHQSTRRGDPRITRVGRFIRATSLDELPQLLNVLGGSMSLVGPRPHALGSRAGDNLFWQIDRRYWLRHTIKPGLTGLAQVRGYRGSTDKEDDLIKRLESDMEYLAHWSLMNDISILIRTVFVMLHRNAY
jgi:lipopolysaccharide/colanic/teichoic acid biosynthesis glycosyltransferase